MPGKDPGGVIVTMLIGVAGSFIAGMLGQAYNGAQVMFEGVRKSGSARPADVADAAT